MLRLPDRYEDLGLIATGGMSEVRRVRDRLLRAVIAMKISLDAVAADPVLRQRFLDEARLTAQLHHPGIIAVHHMGDLEDGRLFFTMEEVRGRTLADALPTLTPRQGVEILLRAARAVGHAHSQGVIHRDLKPENVMVAPHHEVRVMDWGLARRLSEADPLGRLDLGPRDGALTQVGEVLGTLHWMPPEQARGALDRLGPEADVYSLGAILYALLAGHPPYDGPDAWPALLSGPPPPLVQGDHKLRALCALAMSRTPYDRPVDANALADLLQRWLDEDRAMDIVRGAEALLPRLDDLGLRAAAEAERARALLAAVPPHAPAEQKFAGWQAEDQAAALRREARLLDVEFVQRLRGALVQAPELPEAHRSLAARYRHRLLEAEAQGDLDAAAELEALLRAHDRGEHRAWLQGDGRLTLVTNPPAAVTHLRYVARDRRLVPEPVGALGRTPLREVTLPRGSHLLILEAPGHEPVRYPVWIDRGQRWDGVRPGEREPFPIRLPRLGELAPDERYVPAGWTWSGGDPEAPDSLPARRLWVDGFILRRDPVTHEAYLAFLNDLSEVTDDLLPADKTAGAIPTYRRGPDGRWALEPDALGRADPRAPVTNVSWGAACRYATWEAERTGLPWRLPVDLEREKAASGVDRRRQPWGDHLEPAWTNIANSRPGPPALVAVDAIPADESPYGVRGLAGNVRDWCLNPYVREGLPPQVSRVPVAWDPPPDDGFAMIRGGAWSTAARVCRIAARWADPPWRRLPTVGFRLCRSWG